MKIHLIMENGASQIISGVRIVHTDKVVVIEEPDYVEVRNQDISDTDFKIIINKEKRI